MMAKISTRYIQKRTDLTRVIPLDTPIVVFVDPSSLCNFSCGFCPCGNAHKDKWRSGRNAQLMKMDIFKKVVDDIQGFPQRINTLRLYKDGEPLMNRRLPEMIKYAQSKKIAERIDFTTNGSLFDPEFALKLMEAGLTRIIISVEALSSEGYKNVSGINIDFEKFVRNISFLYKNKGDCIIFIKITDVGGGGR